MIFSFKDHPRVCGEHHGLYYSYVDKWGSSPRMRGTHRSAVLYRPAMGIIPAYAGNTCRRLPRIHLPWDHPRVCGEHPELADAPFMSVGSSPRMRGTQYTVKSLTDTKGIIPAYAGNTRNRSRLWRSNRDHPRVCGEHFIAASILSIDPGSSPRMRGTL